MTVVFLETRRPAKPERPLPVSQLLNEVSRETGELADDWLFKMVSEPTKRAMLAERGIAVREEAIPA